MISQPITSETVVVLTPHGINIPQTEKPKPTNQTQDSLKKRLKAEVKVIGSIQILCGVMLLSLGIILGSAFFSAHFTAVFSTLLKSGYPFTGGLCFVISGSLSIITEKRSTKPLVHSSLAGSILSALSALVGSILLSVNLAALGPASLQCELSKLSTPTVHHPFYYHHDPYDIKECLAAKGTLAGVLSVMLICTVLELCLAVLTAVLWWKQAHSDFPGSVLFLPRRYMNKSSMASKVTCDPGYEELLT
ncbi:membrane-spanning 4-domains subfamily A member 6E [Cynocephalus volans]|uniref:membrane-spanning 4-domains subfamily A member 6E n=1 Tax=Cynocephalus volans TaxID=110931 RepID=UPI002FC5A083